MAMDSRGVIELRFADGRTVTGEYEQFTRAHLERGGQFEHEGDQWVMRDREDRRGVTFYVCTPVSAGDEAVSDRSRARARRGMRSG